MRQKGFWSLVQTKARQEHLAAQQLINQDFIAYFPYTKELKREKGQRVFVKAPMFAGYVFVYVGVGQNWQPIASTRGVVKLVRFGGELGRVPTALIDQLKQLEQTIFSETEQFDLKDLFIKGDKLRIIQGPLAGYEAIFDASTGQERALVLIDLVGRSTRMSISMQDIDRAKE